jgi:hypothetical protein
MKDCVGYVSARQEHGGYYRATLGYTPYQFRQLDPMRLLRNMLARNELLRLVQSNKKQLRIAASLRCR